jgi:penicillin-binding protein 2
MRSIARPRLLILRVLVVSLLATLLGRLWFLQVDQASTYRTAAAANQIRDVITQPPRGEIVDDEGRPLLDNKMALVVRVDRSALMTVDPTTGDQVPTAEGTVVLHRLARVLHAPAARLADDIRLCNASTPKPCWNGSPYEPVPVSQLRPTRAATQRALQILEERELFPGVSVETAPVRHYPQPFGAQASTVLGAIGPITQAQLGSLPAAQQLASTNSEVGTTGLEAAYENYLHGMPGIKEVAVNAQGNPTGVVKNTKPVAGDTLVTNLDAKVQALLEQQLQARITAERTAGFSAQWAGGVVMNVRTGGIVAMASQPTYNPDFFDRPTVPTAAYRRLSTSPSTPLVDKAFQGSTPPGSTFKLITSMGTLWDGATTIGTTWPCPSSFGGKTNFDGESASGSITLQHAIEISCDTFFYEIGAQDWTTDENRIKAGQKPVEGVQHIAHMIGIGSTGTGIDLPNAASGSIADRASTKALWQSLKSQWCAGAKRRVPGTSLQRLDAYDCKDGYIFQQGDQESEDIGQESVTASPLEMADAYAAMANGGKVFAPRVGKAIISPSGKVIKRIKAPVRARLPLPQRDITYLRNAFYSVVTGGTAAGDFAGFPENQVKVGGKTGTAELSGTSQNAGWFISFAGPAGGKPQYVTAIEVYKADQGANSAGPAAPAIWDGIYGLQGHPAIFPDGVPPRKLPRLNIAPTPGEKRAERAHHQTSQRSHS